MVRHNSSRYNVNLKKSKTLKMILIQLQMLMCQTMPRDMDFGCCSPHNPEDRLGRAAVASGGGYSDGSKIFIVAPVKDSEQCLNHHIMAWTHCVTFLGCMRFNVLRGQGMDVHRNPEIHLGCAAVSLGGGYSKASNVFIAPVKDS